ncbi:MAG: hypothetical protein CL515_00110 [Actinobacteria bacterium]|nr:hypothetical protein [Actinomycetota bacterium]|tara:strand:- start:6260 stop:7297 length:1038 start_codon:yes stop_codon:yes gene_type:complete
MKDVLDNKLYPGFDLTFSDLKAIKAEKKDTVNIIDYSSMIWVREAIEHLVKEIDDKYKIQFVEPTEADLDHGKKVLNIDVPIEESKKEFSKDKRIIGISSGKGGVGKSTCSSMLALTMTHELGKKVGVMDADIWGYSIPKMLGAIFPPIPFEGRILPSYVHGVKLISMDYFVKKDEAVIWRGPMLHKAIEQFLYEVIWQDIDILLIDMPPGTGDVSISLSQFLPISETLIITTPQKTSSDVAQRAGIMANKVKSDVLGVVENMSFIQNGEERLFPFGEGGGEALAKNLDTSLFGHIPLDPELGKLADSGKLISSKDTEVYKVFTEIGKKIIDTKPKKIPLNISIN